MWGIIRKSIIIYYYCINGKYGRSINYFNVIVSIDFNDKGYFLFCEEVLYMYLYMYLYNKYY